MPHPPVITLDTVCISALANPSDTNDPDEVAALTDLVQRFRHDEVRLQVTPAYGRDFDRWKDEAGREERLKWLAAVPAIPRAPGVFRLDVSVLNGPDLLGGDADVVLDRQLRELLEPVRRDPVNLLSYEDAPGVAAKVMSDVDHLIAHQFSGADWFTTLDRGILRQRSALSALGLEVALPSDIVATLNRSSPA